MDTIDFRVVQTAAGHLVGAGFDTVHTVTITLNGATGGADMFIMGIDPNGTERTMQVGVR